MTQLFGLLLINFEFIDCFDCNLRIGIRVTRGSDQLCEKVVLHPKQILHEENKVQAFNVYLNHLVKHFEVLLPSNRARSFHRVMWHYYLKLHHIVVCTLLNLLTT